MRILAALTLPLILLACGGEESAPSCEEQFEQCLPDAYNAPSQYLAMLTYARCKSEYHSCAGEPVPEHRFYVTDVEVVFTSSVAE